MPSVKSQPVDSDQFTSVSFKNGAGLTNEKDYWGDGMYGKYWSRGKVEVGRSFRRLLQGLRQWNGGREKVG